MLNGDSINVLSKNHINMKPFHISLLNKTAEQFKIIEYPLIILFIITGGTFLMSSSDLVSIFLSIELQSYGLYLLCSIYRNSELATNAGLTYFLLGGLASCIILLGQSLLYINSGNTYLDAIYIINSIFTNEIIISENIGTSIYGENIIVDQYYIQLSMVILSIGFLFKMSAAPFHF
jgi:NADH-ubiquinone oxidoreductase chain 2